MTTPDKEPFAKVDYKTNEDGVSCSPYLTIGGIHLVSGMSLSDNSNTNELEHVAGMLNASVRKLQAKADLCDKLALVLRGTTASLKRACNRDEDRCGDKSCLMCEGANKLIRESKEALSAYDAMGEK